jgi:hypothetical protein
MGKAAYVPRLHARVVAVMHWISIGTHERILAPLTTQDRASRRVCEHRCFRSVLVLCNIDSWLMMIGVAAGVVSDIATPAERGGFFGVSGMGSLV